MLELPPLSLYIHIPWCVRKCPYCDFNSHELSGELPEEEYVRALCEDFDRDYSLCENREIRSIFIGGGTPSLFSPGAFEKLLNHIRRKARLADDAEITLEANPGTVEAGRFKAYYDSGINRLSIGIQSFDDKKLQSLGRIHNGAEARKAVDFCRQAGFDNFNLDLMHGLPEQSVDDALLDIESAIELAPSHISWYQLTIEPNTAFFSKPPSLPTDSLIDTLEVAGHRLLEDAAFRRYEVSAFSITNKESTHNLNYWQFGDYLGIGAGAHGKLSNIKQQSITRLRKHKQPRHYVQNSLSRLAESSEIPVGERALEFLLNALRLRQGFSHSLFEARTGIPFSTIRNKVEYLCSTGLLQQNEKEGQQRLRSTDRGYRLLNSVLEEFL